MNSYDLKIYTTLPDIIFSCSICIYQGFSLLPTLHHLVAVLLVGESMGSYWYTTSRAQVVIYRILGKSNYRSKEVLGSIFASQLLLEFWRVSENGCLASY